MELSFTDFKQQFYSRIHDMRVFDCGDFNLLKVVLDGLKVDYVNKGMNQDLVLKSNLKIKTLLFLKRLKNRAAFVAAEKELAKIGKTKKKYLLFDNGRVGYSETHEKISYYFGNIIPVLGDNNCYTIYQKASELVGGSRFGELDPLKHDALAEDDFRMIADLKQSFARISVTIAFSEVELKNVASAFNNFFIEYRLWRKLLSATDFKVCFFDQHYHREGMMLALKRKGIKSVELQHGLIAPEDIFYVFPPAIKEIAKRALFPDKILTYSNYWSGVLEAGYEFRKDQIDVIGRYQCNNTIVSKEEEQRFMNFTKGRDFILITTQTFLHEHFIAYAMWLSQDLKKRNSDVPVVVKLHPSEKKSTYDAIGELDNVAILDCNTEFLLSRCSHHVTIFSTTLYDASRYQCRNYSLENERCWDYVKACVDSGVSELLAMDENPLDRKEWKGKRGFFYDDFDIHKHKLVEL